VLYLIFQLVTGNKRHFFTVQNNLSTLKGVFACGPRNDTLLVIEYQEMDEKLQSFKVDKGNQLNLILVKTESVLLFLAVLFG
jgi:hypothetical protein